VEPRAQAALIERRILRSQQRWEYDHRGAGAFVARSPRATATPALSGLGARRLNPFRRRSSFAKAWELKGRGAIG